MNESCIEDIHDPIVDFIIEEDQVIGIRKSGKIEEIPYTLKDKEDLIKYLQQKCLYYYQSSYSSNKKWAIFSGVNLALNIGFVTALIMIKANPFINGLCAGWCVFSTPYFMNNMKDSKKKMKEIEEKILLLDSEEPNNQEEKIKELTLSDQKTKAQELSIEPPTEETISKTDPMNTALENNGDTLQSGYGYSTSPAEKPMTLSRKRTY